MRSINRALASLAALGAAALLSGAAFAQEPPPGAPPPPGAEQGHWGEHMREHAEHRAKALHDILNIRPDQEGAFQSFIASMRPEPGQEGMRDHQDMDEMKSLTTPERLDRIAARMSERQARFQAHAAAVRSFYAALSPDQKRAFDALPGLMGMGMRHHDHDGGWGGPGRLDGHPPQG
jgi:Spy/CpxP family protein refolding chaperone